MPEEGTAAMSREEVEALIEDLSTNVGLTGALADDMLDAGHLVSWAAGHLEADEAEAEAAFTEVVGDLESCIRELREEGYDTPMIVLGLWTHIQQIELFLRDAPEEETEDPTPPVEYLPVDESLPETPLRPVEEVEALIEDLSTNVGLTEALADDVLDAGHLVTWAATRTHDGMSPEGEAEFTEVLERLGEFIEDQLEAGREWPVVVYGFWVHVQELERFLRENQPTPEEEERDRPRYIQ